MYQYVQPTKVLAALQWLKLNNPLYKDVQINSDWVSNAAEDDAELWEALSTEHCPPPPSSQSTEYDTGLWDALSTEPAHHHYHHNLQMVSTYVILVVNIYFLFPGNQIIYAFLIHIGETILNSLA